MVDQSAERRKRASLVKLKRASVGAGCRAIDTTPDAKSVSATEAAAAAAAILRDSPHA